MTDLNRRIIDMTAGEFLELLESKQKPVIVTEKRNKYVYGLAGICTLFNCSVRTANRIKQEGRIAPAIKQSGRKIIIDSEMALSLLPNP